MRRQRGLFWVLMVAAVGFWLLVHRTTFDRAFLAIGWASEGTLRCANFLDHEIKE